MNLEIQNNAILDSHAIAQKMAKHKMSSSNTFLLLFKQWMRIVLLSASLLQIIFFWSLENIFATACVLLAWRLTEKFTLRAFNLNRYSLSTLIILGYTLTQFCLPLVFTLIEGKPLVYNLNFPYQVFIHSVLALLVLLLVHTLYTYWQNKGSFLRYKMQKILGKTLFFQSPTNSEIWIIGFIGLAGMVGNYFADNHYGGIEDSDRGGTAKLIQGLIPFAYAPFFLLLKKLYNPVVKTSQLPVTQIVIYTLILIIIGIGGNSRGLFMIGVTSAAIAYFLGLLMGKFDYNIINIRNVVVASIGLWLITGPLSDLGTAMVVVRGQRSDVSSFELISKTFNVYEDKSVLDIYKRAAMSAVSEWDEHYFDNIFLARFCNLKFNDSNLKNAIKIGHVDTPMQEYSIDKFWSILPQPILNLLQIKIDKNKILSSSFGDYLFMRGGGTNALGSFRTGHFAGTSMAAFGWWYLLLLAIAMFPVFFLMDLFVLYSKKSLNKGSYISFAGLLSITSIFTFLSISITSQSVISIYTFLVRGWIQLAVLYWFVFFLARKISIFK